MAHQRLPPHSLRRSRKGHYGRVARDLDRLCRCSRHYGKCRLIAADRQPPCPQPRTRRPAPGSASPARARRSEEISLAGHPYCSPPAGNATTTQPLGSSHLMADGQESLGKRTSDTPAGMSARGGQLRTHASQQISVLFDHLVRGRLSIDDGTSRSVRLHQTPREPVKTAAIHQSGSSRRL